MMDDLFGITSEPEFIKVLVAKVKEAATQGGITDKDTLYALYCASNRTSSRKWICN